MTSELIDGRRVTQAVIRAALATKSKTFWELEAALGEVVSERCPIYKRYDSELLYLHNLLNPTEANVLR